MRIQSYLDRMEFCQAFGASASLHLKPKQKQARSYGFDKRISLTQKCACYSPLSSTQT